MNVTKYANVPVFRRIKERLARRFKYCKLLPSSEREFSVYTIFTTPIVWEKSNTLVLFSIKVTISRSRRLRRTESFIVVCMEGITDICPMIINDNRWSRFQNLPKEVRNEVLRILNMSYKKVAVRDEI